MDKKEKLTLTKDARRTKRRLSKTRAKAQFVGFLYLLGTILLAALAVLPTLSGIDGVNVLGEDKKIWEDLSLGLNLDTITRALYALMLLTVVINVFRSLAKLGWLYSKKASQTFGLNRNVFAMQKMGKIFSGSFAVIIIFNFLIVLLNKGSFLGEGLTDYKVFNSILASNMFLGDTLSEMISANIVLIVAVGVVFHLICGWFGAKVSLFSVDEGVGIIEQRREVGRFAALIRNLLQVVVALAIPYLVLKVTVLDTFVADMLKVVNDGAEMPTDITLPALQAAIVLFWTVLVKHATATTEFNLDGAKGKGMKNFTVFVFFTLAASAAMYFMNGDKYGSFAFDNKEGVCALAIAGISFVMFLVQFLMRKAPCRPEDKVAELDEVTIDENGNPVSAAEEESDPDIVSVETFIAESTDL